jgi:hypothetical protein
MLEHGSLLRETEAKSKQLIKSFLNYYGKKGRKNIIQMELLWKKLESVIC